MRLSDIMGHMGLAFYAEVGLVIFFAVFVAVALRLIFARRELAATYDRARFMPLEDDDASGAPEAARSEQGGRP